MLSRLYSVEQQNTPGCTGFEYTPAFKLAVVLIVFLVVLIVYCWQYSVLQLIVGQTVWL